MKRVIRVLNDSLVNEIAWPTDEEMERHCECFQSLQTLPFKRIVCSVGGSKIKVHRPEPSKRHLLYSGEKKISTVLMLFTTLLDGRIISLSKAQTGTNDHGLWNREGLREKLNGKSCGLSSDGGFVLNNKKKSNYNPWIRPIQKSWRSLDSGAA